MNRTVIILLKSLPIGEACNIAAILSGQLAQMHVGMYSTVAVNDKQGFRHAGIENNIVILKAKSSQQLINFGEELLQNNPKMTPIFFTCAGQKLSNSSNEYKNTISISQLSECDPVGVAIHGIDMDVRTITKRFSLMT